MNAKVDRIILCNCEGSQSVDASSVKTVSGVGDVKTCTHLCTDEIDIAAEGLTGQGPTLIACGQQSALFEDLWAEVEGPGTLLTVDLRDRAGWTADADAHPKQSALIAEALLDRPNTPMKDLTSSGLCLIMGKAEDVLPAALKLCEILSVTCLLTDTTDDLTPDARFDVAIGSVTSAKGAFTNFTLTIDGYAPQSLGGRGPSRFGATKNVVTTTCDILLDLTGNDALFPASEKRDGYLRAAPNDLGARSAAFLKASELIGSFEKPLYIRFDPQICAHSRASQSGCSRCLNVCPTGAILSNGDTVEIDPDICAGCGACAAVCPSGAASYEDPPVGYLFSRLRTLATTYADIAGHPPRALFHDASFGKELIEISARFGKGLPSDVIPVEVSNVDAIGHAEMLAALGVGFSQLKILMAPKTDFVVVQSQLELAQAILKEAGETGTRVSLLDAATPDEFEDALYQDSDQSAMCSPVLPLGDRRNVTRIVANAISPQKSALPLPPGSPYGAIEIDTDACTLCLACVSLCPVGALTDNTEKPQVNFQEAACLQCGICKSTCPETAISLKPQLNLADSALSPVVLNEEDPFECISCGAPFGTKSTIERIVAQLKDKHSMFTNSDNFKLIQMCDDCRVNAQYHQENSPFKSADRPAVRTTQDYLDERKKH